MKRKLVEVANKYHTIDTFDYFADREMKEEDQKKRDQKYVWKAKDGDGIGDLRLMNEKNVLGLKNRIKKVKV